MFEVPDFNKSKQCHQLFRCYRCQLMFKFVKITAMKNYLVIFTTLFLVACQPSLEQRISELHTATQKLGDEAVMLLGDLVQQRNSINIQGRALTPQEIAFTGKVDALEAKIGQWEEALDAEENSLPGKSRLEKEEALRDEITALLAEARQLVAAPPGK